MKISILTNYAAILFLVIGLSSCNFKANKEYKKAIESADSHFSQNKYNDAKTFYTKALEFKPEEQYPKEKISAIDKILLKEKSEKLYKLHIKNADNLFNKENYTEAKELYIKASEIKAKEEYPKNKIQEIDKILAEIKKQEEYMSYRYHIVVGCFAVESNAVRLNAKLLKQGNNSRIIKMANGRLSAVTYASFPNLNKSYNNLKEALNEFKEAWVFKH